MPKKEESGAGFQQAAGLVRYFEAEETSALHIPPILVLVVAFLIGFVLVVFETWCTPGASCFGA